MATPPTPIQAPTPAAEAAAAAAPPHLPHMTDEELRKVFDQFDANGDGKISAAELSQVLAAMGSAVPPEDLDRAMAEIDADGDGFISLPEFAGLCRSGPSPDADLRDAFDLYDQDRNGLISAAELHLVLNRLSMNCSVEDCARMIKSVDGDGDGNVNFEEFRKMMASKGPESPGTGLRTSHVGPVPVDRAELLSFEHHYYRQYEHGKDVLKWPVGHMAVAVYGTSLACMP